MEQCIRGRTGVVLGLGEKSMSEGRENQQHRRILISEVRWELESF